MSGVLQFLLLGLGLGGVYALIAQGLVIVYRGSGVLNLAQGAFAYVGATVYYDVRESAGQSVAVSVIAGVLSAAVVGALVHPLIMRPMRRASSLARLVATLGLMVAIENLIEWQTNEAQRVVPQFLPHGALKITSSIVVGSDRVVIFFISVPVTILLWLTYTKTRFGIITTAAAENEEGAAAAGHSPNRIATLNWTIGSALAGFGGILVAPIVGLSPNTLSLLIVPVLACALVGGFTSFGLTLFGALAIGVAQSEIGRFVSYPGWSASAPLVLIAVVLFVRGRPLPVRRYVVERLPMVGSGRMTLRYVGPLAIAAAAITYALPAAWQEAAGTTFIGITLALSLVVVTGMAGQLSLCQVGFAGMAAWAAGRLTADWGITFPEAFVIGALFMIPLGLAVGIPALRTRGVNLAIITLAIALVFDDLVFQNTSITGGFSGTNVGDPSLFGWSIGSNDHPWRYGVVALLVASASAVCVANLRRSSSGRRLIAVRSNERAAASLGVGVFASKLYAFTVGAVLAGGAGVLLAFQNPFINFSNFAATQSLYLVMYVVLAGVGFISGGMLGGVLIVGGLANYLAIVLFSSSVLYQAIAGLVLVVTMVLNPDGLVVANIRQIAWIRTKARPILTKFSLPFRVKRPAKPVVVSADEPAMPKPRSLTSEGPPAVEVSGLTVRFGGVVALDNVSLQIQPGEVVGLIGPNGAGKTTAIDAISGFIRDYEGTIKLAGNVVSGRSPATRTKRGLRRTFQSLELFEDISVYENLLVGCQKHNASDYLLNLVKPKRSRLTRESLIAVEEFGLAGDLERLPTELPYGRRRLVGIARAVSVPLEVLLLDEPAAGLDQIESRELGQLIRRFAVRSGVAVLIVEHDFDLVMSLCDRLIALDFGRKIADGPPLQTSENGAVRAAYLGVQDQVSVGVGAGPDGSDKD